MSDQAAVRRLTHSLGPNFSVGFRFLAPAKRRAVYAAYAVCRVADDIVDEVEAGTSIDEARRALDDFEAEVEAAYAGRPQRTETRALAAELERFPIPKAGFLGLIEGCRWDLVKHRYADFAELERYCELVAVTISDISLAIFGVARPEAEALGRNLAMALQLTNICRDVGEDTGRARIYLPADERERFGVGEEDLFARRPTPAFLELMAMQTGRARGYFRAANPLPGAIERDARLGVRLMGLIYVHILERIARAPAAVLTRRVRPGPLGRYGAIAAGLLGRPFVP